MRTLGRVPAAAFTDKTQLSHVASMSLLEALLSPHHTEEEAWSGFAVVL